MIVTMSALDTCLREIEALKAFDTAHGADLDQLGRILRAEQLAGLSASDASIRWLSGQVEMYRDMARVTIRAARKFQAEAGRVPAAVWVDIRFYRRSYLAKAAAKRARLVDLQASISQAA